MRIGSEVVNLSVVTVLLLNVCKSFPIHVIVIIGLIISVEI